MPTPLPSARSPRWAGGPSGALTTVLTAAAVYGIGNSTMAQKATILFAEMDTISTRLLTFVLQQAGFQALPAQGGADLLRLARQHKVDLILLEVLLPDADGLNIVRQLRADWTTRFIPVAFLTTLIDVDYRVGGLLAGADDYITKPYDLNELMVRLHRLIETFATCFQLQPLTRLPSNPLIREYVTTLAQRAEADPWALLWIDINHFRAYNQLYGYAAGDEVLKMTAELLRTVVHTDSSWPTFVGHEGRDDFMAGVPLGEATAICERLIQEFDRRILAHYPPDQRDKPFQTLLDRRGNMQEVPRLALSIGVVTSDLCANLSYLELQEVGTAVMNRARAEETSFFYVNQRRAANRPAIVLAR
jgi:PleD family two-component response regulator